MDVSRLTNHRTAYLLTYLSVLHLLVWLTQFVGITDDSFGQLTTLRQIAQGIPAYFPPGYPLLVGLGHLIWAAKAGLVITLVQHAMMIVTILWCFWLLERCVGALIACGATLVMGVAAPTLLTPQAILSENVALFGMTGALYYAVRYRDRGRTRDGITGGLLLGWATLARIVPMAGGFPAIFVVMLGAKPLSLGVKRFGIAMAVALLVVVTTIAWFAVRDNRFVLADSLGFHLYDRVFTAEGLIDPYAPATMRLQKLAGPVDLRSVPHWKVGPPLGKKNLDDWQVESLLRQASLEGISKAPLTFIGFSLRQVWRQYFENPTPQIPSGLNYQLTQHDPTLELPPILSARGTLWRYALERGFAVIWPVIPWLSLAGLVSILFVRERGIFLSFAIIAFGYLLATALVEFELPRYDVAIIPFMFCLAAGPFALFGTVFDYFVDW